MQTKTLKLNDGGTLEITYDEKLLTAVRKHYSLSSNQDVPDDCLRDFLIETCRTAVQKAESNTFNHA